MNSKADTVDDNHSRLSALISYLQDLHALRNPPIRKISQHAAFGLDPQQLKGLPGITIRSTDDIWLTSELLVPPSEPALPSELVDVAIPRLVGRDRPVARAEADDAERAGLEQWNTSVWDAWMEEVDRIEKSRRLYLDLFEVQDQLEADTSNLELIWGFGIVRWREHDIEYPLFTVGLEFDYTAEDTRLDLRPNRPLRAETEILAGLPLVAQRQLLDAMTAVESSDSDPWLKEFESEVLTPLLVMMSHTPPDEGGPRILAGEWAVFLRRRPSGYLSFVRGLEGNLNSLSNLPTLASLVANDPWQFDTHEPDSAAASDGWTSSSNGVLLPLPANDEQRQILRYAGSSPGVTVEGPPGTGKSHTIANLISGFIADGKRVLVTAERSQALKVLLDKIPEALQPLCVPVLGSGQEDRIRLENAIDRISQAKFGLNANQTDVERLPQELDEISRSIANIHNRLRGAREVEALQVPEFVPAECRGSWDEVREGVADWLHKYEEQFSFVSDLLEPSAMLPWTTTEQRLISQAFATIPVADLHRSLDLGHTNPLPASEVIRQRFRDREAWLNIADGSQTPVADTELQREEELDSLGEQINLAAAEVSNWQTSPRRVVFEELAGGQKQELWRIFARDIDSAIREAYSLRGLLQSHHLDLPDEVPFSPTDTQLLLEAKATLAIGRRLGFSHRRARQLLGECRVDGQIPSRETDVALVLAESDLRSIRLRIRNQVNSMRESLAIPKDDGVEAEDEVAPVSLELNAMIDWLDTRGPSIQSQLKGLGVKLDRISDGQALREAHSAVKARLAASKVARLDKDHSLLLEELRERMQTSTAPDLWQILDGALEQGDWNGWDETLSEINRLSTIQSQSREINALLDRLAEEAPHWAEHLKSSGNLPAKNEDEIKLAWVWRKVETWFRSTEVKENPSELEVELQRLERVQQSLVSQLAAARAWLEVAGRIDGPTQRDLAAYKAVSARLGKGYSKFKSTYQRQLNEALAGCRHVIPAWVMPVERVLTDFVCEAEPIFDVLIIDEASQLPMTRLPILALARKVVVVGDDKQISPSLPGVEIQPSLDALRNRLGTIPNAGATFFVAASVYDVAMQRFPRKVQLREHFRCLTPIIEFSNSRYYDERLVPLRDRMPTLHWKPLNSILVEDGYRDGDDCNRPEAERIAELISELIRKPEYASRSFGVITLLGRNQSKLLHDLIFEAIGPAKMALHSVRIGDAATFQGDERDVILISTVVSDSGGRAIGAMTQKLHQQMVNVAASRARDQLWIIHSVPADAFPNGDERAALVRHCSARLGAGDAYEELVKKTDSRSQFERDFLRHLVGRGYRTIRPQHQVGSYFIDFVIDGPSSRLAVECDGDKYHPPEKWEADRARQSVLERAGWVFVRIRGSSFYRDPARALEPLWEKLEELQIPAYDWTAESPQTPDLSQNVPDLAEVVSERSVGEKAKFKAKEPRESQPGAAKDEQREVAQVDDPASQIVSEANPQVNDDPWAAAFQAADEQIRKPSINDAT
jgi:very-short-patch-repair endonuclease/DNA polymerase III delta prime subunit